MENDKPDLKKLVNLYTRNPQEFYKTIFPMTDDGDYYNEIIKPALLKCLFVYVKKSAPARIIIGLFILAFLFPPAYEYGSGISYEKSYAPKILSWSGNNKSASFVFITTTFSSSSKVVNTSSEDFSKTIQVEGNFRYEILYLQWFIEFGIIGILFYAGVIARFKRDEKKYKMNLQGKIIESRNIMQSKYDSKSFIEEFTKYYKLMDNKLMSEEEYFVRKSGLYEKLRIKGINQDVESFLSEIIVLKECGWINQEELEKINHIVN